MQRCTSQVADLASAAQVAAAAALRLQEAPNTLDIQLLLLLLGHAAVTQQLPLELVPPLNPAADPDSRACCLQLATAAADYMAVQQQYADRFGYLQYHAAAVLWQWFLSGKHTFEQLTLLQPLLCQHTSTTADNAAAAAAVLDQYGSSITVSLLHNLDDDQQLAAAAAGVQLPALLERYRIHVFGTLLPLTKYPQLKPRMVLLAGKAGKTPRTVRQTLSLNKVNAQQQPSSISSHHVQQEFQHGHLPAGQAGTCAAPAGQQIERIE